MKKLLILGANNSQIQIIKSAKEEGYYVIACDYTNDNPGIPLVDKHYQVSYLDRERVLSIARQERINGIIGNTDPAMPVVAYISEQLGLVGNNPDTINRFISKFEFRQLQKQAGIFCPKYIESDECAQAEAELEGFNHPIIVKPSIYSASRGVTKIFKNQTERFHHAFQLCKELSLNGKVTIEEYVEMSSMETIEGDVFVMGDEILWNGIFTTRRSIMAPMIPMTYIFPAILSYHELSIIKTTISKVFKKAGVRYGEYNIEMYFTSEGELFIIEINPRQGGHRITQMIKQHTGIDFNKLLVTTVVGCNEYYDSIRKVNEARNFLTHHVIFSNYSGIFEGIEQKPIITKYITGVEFPKAVGTTINQRKNGADYIAYTTLQFPDRDTQLSYCGEQIERLIYPVVKNKQYPIADCTLPYQLIYDFMTGDAYNFFVPKLAKVHRTPEDYAAQLAAYCTIAYDLDDNNQIKGMIAGYTHNLRIKDWSYAAEFYVNSTYRGKGLGEELFKTYIDYCKSRHLKGIWLNVKEENTMAQNCI